MRAYYVIVSFIHLRSSVDNAGEDAHDGSDGNRLRQAHHVLNLVNRLKIVFTRT